MADSKTQARSISKISLPPPAPRLIPGHRLDRYELLCPIAQGGMASVWVARIQGVHGFEKLVAVKTILAEYATDPQYEAMFLNEARLIANIHHHNVAEILDLGSHDSVLYLVLEWIEGDSLALLERSASRHKRPIPVPVGLRIVAQMCAGLSAAHELKDRSGRSLNVVHRDVSPQNVLVSVTGEVKLIDFGIAKAHDQLTANTNTGVLKGKISFMSPEQALGQPLDSRADIWSAGVVLYQLLSGELPFRGGSQLETLHIIGACKRAPPIPGLPTVLQKLLDRVLEPNRDKRIGSAAELESELERVASQLGAATTRDLATVVQEHLGSRVAARRGTIDTALAAADGRQKLTQVFDAAIERARQSDDSATESFLAGDNGVPRAAAELGNPTPRVIPSLSLLAQLEPSLVTLTAPHAASATAPVSPITGVVRVQPQSARPRAALAEHAREAKRGPRGLRSAAIVGASVFAVAGVFAAFASRSEPTSSAEVRAGSAEPAHALASASSPALIASAPVPAPSLPVANVTSVEPLASASAIPAIEATDLPLAAPQPSHSSPPAAHRALHAPRPQPKRDVWSAFSEHR